MSLNLKETLLQGSHGSVPTKTFIGNKSRNKVVEAARKRFELGDVINMLNDIDSLVLVMVMDGVITV